MAVVPVSPHQVDTVAVLVPESPLIGQGTVGDGRVCVLVEGGEGPAIVVGHGVTWERERTAESWSSGWAVEVPGRRPMLGWAGLEREAQD